MQELRLDGNWLRRVPSEALKGPTGLQDLHLEDNVIGDYDGNVVNGRREMMMRLVGKYHLGRSPAVSLTTGLPDQNIRPRGESASRLG